MYIFSCKASFYNKYAAHTCVDNYHHFTKCSHAVANSKIKYLFFWSFLRKTCAGWHSLLERFQCQMYVITDLAVFARTASTSAKNAELFLWTQWAKKSLRPVDEKLHIFGLTFIFYICKISCQKAIKLAFISLKISNFPGGEPPDLPFRSLSQAFGNS